MQSIVLFVFLHLCSYKTDRDWCDSNHVLNTDSGKKEAREDTESPCPAVLQSGGWRGPRGRGFPKGCMIYTNKHQNTNILTDDYWVCATILDWMFHYWWLDVWFKRDSQVEWLLSHCLLVSGVGYFLKTSLVTRANTCCLQIFAFRFLQRCHSWAWV